jgi:hypothetical protein
MGQTKDSLEDAIERIPAAPSLPRTAKERCAAALALKVEILKCTCATCIAGWERKLKEFYGLADG